MVMYWKGKRVPVTGGAGFIGSHSARKLVKKGAFVRIADNLSRRRTGNISDILNQIESIMAGLIKEENCFNSCNGLNIVFHLATSVGGIEYPKKANAKGCVPSILMKTYMLEASARYGVEHFLFTFSTCIYHAYCEGRETPVHLKEESAHPNSL